MPRPNPARALSGLVVELWRRARSPIPQTVAGLARRLDPHEAGVLLAYHRAHDGEPGYVAQQFGIAAAERAIRRRGWDRAELIRAGRARLVAVGLAEPTELEARRRRAR